MIPEINIILVVFLFRVAAFENQRWVRQRMQGMRGSSEEFGVLVDMTMTIGTVLWYGFLGMYAFDYGIVNGLILWVMALAFMIIYGIISGPIFGGDKLLILFIGTLLTVPLGAYLVFKTTVFGLI